MFQFAKTTFINTIFDMKTHYIRALRPLIHIIVIGFAFLISYMVRQYTDLIPWVQIRIPPFVIPELIQFAVISMVVYVLIWLQRKLFQLNGLVFGYYQRFIKTIVAWGIVITCIAYFGSGFIFDWGISRFIIVVTVISSLIGISLIDRIFDLLLYHVWRQYQIAMIAVDADRTQESMQLLRSTTPAQLTIIDYHQLNLSQLSQYDTIIVVGSLTIDKLQDIADYVTINGQEFFHINHELLLQDLIFTPQKLWPLVGLEYKATVIDEWSMVIKRMIDIVGAIIGLILTSPIRMYVAIRIKSEDGGPVFFVQERVWRGERLFQFWKFRSMKIEYCTGYQYGGKRADAYYQSLIESDLNTRPWSMPKIHDDPRVTNIWAWIRRTSLDELPQLINVLLWTMSLIWPRPHLPREVAQYESRQHRLLSIKPGITWYAQIFGRDTLDFNEEAKLDLYYIQNRSLWLDVYVLFATLGVISKGR